MFRIGQGYDIHIFEEDRPLIIGGLKIREKWGLKGHSDADVLVHAIMDSLLGAAGLRDIGYYFPDTDPAYKGISSLKLLEIVRNKITEKGYIIGNIDTIVVCEKPKLKDFIPTMIQNLADCLKIKENQITIKATTKEQMDATGEGLSVESYSIALIYKKM